MLDPSIPLMMVRRERYAQARSRGLNREEAHADAGYPPPNSGSAANNTEGRSGMKERIAWLVQEDAEAQRGVVHHEEESKAFEEAMGKAAILEGLRQVFELAIHSPTVIDKAGKAYEGAPNNLAAANRALELMGKEDGMFIDRKHITTFQEGDGMDKAALLKAIQGIDEQLAAMGVRPMLDVTPPMKSGALAVVVTATAKDEESVGH